MAQAVTVAYDGFTYTAAVPGEWTFLGWPLVSILRPCYSQLTHEIAATQASAQHDYLYDPPPSPGLSPTEKGFIAGGVLLFVLSWAVYICLCFRNRGSGRSNPAFGRGLPREQARALGLEQPWISPPSFPAPAYNHSGHNQSWNYGHNRWEEERRRQEDRRTEEDNRPNQYSWNSRSNNTTSDPDPYRIAQEAARQDRLRAEGEAREDRLRADERARNERAYIATYDASYR